MARFKKGQIVDVEEINETIPHIVLMADDKYAVLAKVDKSGLIVDTRAPKIYSNLDDKDFDTPIETIVLKVQNNG